MIQSNEVIVKNLIDNGNTYSNIAKVIGRSRERVRQICVKNGWVRKPFNYTLPKILTPIQRLKASGLSWCRRCKKTESEVTLTTHAKRGDKTYHTCLECNATKMRAYYATEKGKENMLKAKAKYEAKKLLDF